MILSSPSQSIHGGLTIDGIEPDNLTHQQCTSELLEEGEIIVLNDAFHLSH